MTNFIIGSDRINGHEKSILSEVISKVEKKGHTVINAGVSPGGVQNKSKKAGSDVAVLIVGGIDGQLYSDYAVGMGKYYKVNKAIFPLTSWIYKGKPSNDIHHKENIPNYKMQQPHDAGGALKKMYAGKTVKEFMKEHSNIKVFGADTVDEIVRGILGEEDEKKKDKNKTSYLEMVKDLLKPWDGDVEIYQREDKVYIHKVPLPDENKLPKALYDGYGKYHFIPSNDIYYASEGVNIKQGGISVHDYNPNSINDLTVEYYDMKKKQNRKLHLRDLYLIERFGEVSDTVQAEEDRADNSLKNVEKASKKNKKVKKEKKKKGKSKTKKTKKTKKKSKKKKKEKKKEDNTVDHKKDKNQDKSTYKKVAITDRVDAKEFARRAWYKNMRDNGHGVDVEVIGIPEFKSGMWTQLYAPSFGENLSMYVAQCDHNLAPNSEWTTKLHLLDYVPSFSKLTDEDMTKDEEDENQDGQNADGSKSGKGKGKGAGSGNKTSKAPNKSRNKRTYNKKVPTWTGGANRGGVGVFNPFAGGGWSSIKKLVLVDLWK